MRSDYLSFLLKLVLLTVLMGSALYYMEGKIPERFFYHGYAGLLVFFFCVTLLLHLGYEKSFSKGSKYFVRFFMLAGALKLLGFLSIILAFAFLEREHITGFALNFLVMYFVYSSFELIISYKKFGATADLSQ